MIEITSNEGYEFAVDASGIRVVPDIKATVNGIACTVDKVYDQAPQDAVSLTCDFGQLGVDNSIKTVAIFGIDAPVTGRTPDFFAYTEGEGYAINLEENGGGALYGIYWTYRENNTTYALTSDKTFQPGVAYTLNAILITTGNRRFAVTEADNPAVTATVDGTAATAVSYAARPAKDCIRVTLTYPATAAQSQVTGKKVSGTVTSTGSASEAVTLRLYPAGQPEAAYETVVYGNSASYSFDSVVPGSYTLSVTKKNHVPFEKDVTVSGSALTVNVTLESTLQYLVGDLNADGTVDSADAIYLLYNTLFGDARYPLNQPADFNKDAKVDSADAIYLLYHTLFGAARYPLA